MPYTCTLSRFLPLKAATSAALQALSRTFAPQSNTHAYDSLPYTSHYSG